MLADSICSSRQVSLGGCLKAVIFHPFSAFKQPSFWMFFDKPDYRKKPEEESSEYGGKRQEDCLIGLQSKNCNPANYH